MVIWILDSKCSRHITSDEALLSQLIEKVGTIGYSLKMTTKEYIKLEMSSLGNDLSCGWTFAQSQDY